MNEKMFDSLYVTPSATVPEKPKEVSQVKQFLRAPVSEEEMGKYGSSKPMRVILRARLINNKN